MHRTATIVLGICFTAVLASCRDTAVETPADPVSRVETKEQLPYDHHVHILSPVLVADWKSLGIPFSKPDEVYVSAAGLLESGGSDRDAVLSGAFLVSMGHIYGHPEFRAGFGFPVDVEQVKVRGQNDHVASEAARYSDRAVAFCSVPILRPYADEELAHCFDVSGMKGLKIHVASSEVDLREEAHLARLAELVAMAGRRNVPVLLHLDPQMRGHETKHIRDFIDRVLEPNPGVDVVIAHLGGSGGYGAWTASVLRTFIEWIEEREARGAPVSRVWFDVSAALLARESEGVPAATDEEAAAMASDLRRLGLERVVFGSDYPVFAPGEYFQQLSMRLGLTPDERLQMLTNRVVPTERVEPASMQDSAR